MLTVGPQEMIAIIILALVLCGKELPQLRRTISNAIVARYGDRYSHVAEEPMFLAAISLGLLAIYLLIRITTS